MYFMNVSPNKKANYKVKLSNYRPGQVLTAGGG